MPHPSSITAVTSRISRNMDDARTGITDVFWQPVEERVADQLCKEQT